MNEKIIQELEREFVDFTKNDLNFDIHKSIKDLGFDSMTFVLLLVRLEEKFGVTFSDEFFMKNDISYNKIQEYILNSITK